MLCSVDGISPFFTSTNNPIAPLNYCLPAFLPSTSAAWQGHPPFLAANHYTPTIVFSYTPLTPWRGQEKASFCLACRFCFPYSAPPLRRDTTRPSYFICHFPFAISKTAAFLRYAEIRRTGRDLIQKGGSRNLQPYASHSFQVKSGSRNWWVGTCVSSAPNHVQRAAASYPASRCAGQ